MLKFSQLVISLPILVLPLATFSMRPALAETVGVERALELLAQSAVIDSVCDVLSVAERDELSTYVSRAEVSAAEKTTLETVRSAMASGKKSGLATSCGEQASAEVKETLSAAREAIKAVEAQDQNASSEPVVASGEDAGKKYSQAGAMIQTSASLAAYGRVTEAYYLERRCAYLAKPAINSFYRAILQNHFAAVAHFGKPAVSAAKRNAEGRANAQSCDSAGRARVRAGYAEIANR